MNTHFPPPPFSKEVVRQRTPWGNMTTHPTSPAPWAGVTSHLPRLAGEDGRGCSCLFRASADGPAETTA
jgi:hypothetical protein